MSKKQKGLPLHITLTSPVDAAAAPGQTLQTVGDLHARLAVETDLRLTLGLPGRSRAELRWMVDQVLRKLRRLYSIGRVRLTAEASVDDDTMLTVALDLHNAFGSVKFTGRRGVARRHKPIAAAEDGYRNWVNEDPSTRTSIQIAADVTEWAKAQDNVAVEVLDEVALKDKGLNLLCAVGGASKVSPPRLVIAHYSPQGASGPPLMLLGKGITFDTGGINVKPYESYVSMMKNDMAGSALAWWLFRGLVELGMTRPLIVVLPTCENSVGEDAMRPGALVKSYRGHVVRVDHTDAEGRLALADGLAYAADRYKPDQVICFATLTTAALIAYGPYATPVHFAQADLRQRMSDMSDRTGEDLHFFEPRIWHFEANRDPEADLKNTARLPAHASRSAGSRNAAHFLQHFTDVPLVHLDIFASTWNWAGDAPGSGYGATGAPMRTLLQVLSEKPPAA